jgi:excinuclease ABC subunit C
MKIEHIKQYNLPDEPGIYFFKQGTDILYIGKATSLRDRVRSYFSLDLIKTRGPHIVDMVFKADSLEHIKTDSVLEALILEANLIKKYQPNYNSKEKDDKSFNYVVITREAYPQVLLVRGKDLDEHFPKKEMKYVFGPYPHGLELKEGLRIIRRIFPYRDARCVPLSGKPCFNRQIGLCPGVCTGEISIKEYGRIIRNIKLLFEGKNHALIRTLTKEMKICAKEQAF